MATTITKPQKKRLALSINEDIDQKLSLLSTKLQIPKATTALNLLQEALEWKEDQGLIQLAQEREEEAQTPSNYISDDEIWT